MSGHSYEVFWQLMAAVVVESSLVVLVCLAVFKGLNFGLRQLNASMSPKRGLPEGCLAWEQKSDSETGLPSNAA